SPVAHARARERGHTADASCSWRNRCSASGCPGSSSACRDGNGYVISRSIHHFHADGGFFPSANFQLRPRASFLSDFAQKRSNETANCPLRFHSNNSDTRTRKSGKWGSANNSCPRLNRRGSASREYADTVSKSGSMTHTVKTPTSRYSCTFSVTSE